MPTKTSIMHLRKKNRRNGEAERTGFSICQDIGFTISTKANQRVKVVDGQGDLPAILSEIVTPPPKPKFVKWLDDATTFERWDAQHHASLSVEIEKRLAKRADFELRHRAIEDLAEQVGRLLTAERTRALLAAADFLQVLADAHRPIVLDAS